MKALGPRSLASALKRILDVLFYLLLVPLVLLVVLLAVVPFVDSAKYTASPQVAITFDPEAYDLAPNDPDIRRFGFEKAWGSLEIEGTNRPSFYAGLVFAMVLLGLLLFVVRELRRVFATLRDSDPFVPQNATRIRNVGLCIIAGELLTHGFHFWSYFLYVVGRVSVVGVRLGPRFEPSLIALFAGLALLAVAAVFRVGARLREEQSLTV